MENGQRNLAPIRYAAAQTDKVVWREESPGCSFEESGWVVFMYKLHLQLPP